jgi:hypothetical protein
MRAVDCDELRDRAFVVCLSTPFLQAFARNLPKGVLAQIWVVLSVLASLLLDLAFNSRFLTYLTLPLMLFLLWWVSKVGRSSCDSGDACTHVARSDDAPIEKETGNIAKQQ